MNLDWDDATKTYNLTKKAIDDRENFKLKRDLKGVGLQTVVKSQAYSPDQVAALTDPAEKEGGEWIEADQNYKMPDGSRRIATNTPTWENGAYQNSNGEAVAPKAQYSFGGQTRDTDFTPDEVKGLKMQSRADIYRNYGKDTEADQLESAGLQRRAAMQQIAKGDKEIERDKKWEDHKVLKNTLMTKASEVEKQVDALLAKGDNAGAAQLMVDFRTKDIPDGRSISISGTGGLSGTDYDGTKKQTDLNVYNPGVVAKMRAELKGSVSDYLETQVPSQGFERDQVLSNAKATADQRKVDNTRNDKKDTREIARDAVEDAKWDKKFELETKTFNEQVAANKDSRARGWAGINLQRAEYNDKSSARAVQNSLMALQQTYLDPKSTPEQKANAAAGLDSFAKIGGKDNFKVMFDAATGSTVMYNSASGEGTRTDANGVTTVIGKQEASAAASTKPTPAQYQAYLDRATTPEQKAAITAQYIKLGGVVEDPPSAQTPPAPANTSVAASPPGAAEASASTAPALSTAMSSADAAKLSIGKRMAAIDRRLGSPTLDLGSSVSPFRQLTSGAVVLSPFERDALIKERAVLVNRLN